MQRSITLAATVAAALIGGAALAGPALAQDQKPSFSEADANGDGTVSMKEARDLGFDRYQFVAQDVNQDGKLTKEDWHYLSTNSNFVLYDVGS